MDLEKPFEYERKSGILNGIDTDVWDPQTDNFLAKNYDKELVEKGKKKNKKEICGQFGLDPDKPLVAFIGRLVGEKAADLLPDAISQSIYQHHGKANFLVLGSGEPHLEDQLDHMKHQFNGYFNSYIGYSEPLSHLIYAGSDFLLMPSRVEPCGLNHPVNDHGPMQLTAWVKNYLTKHAPDLIVPGSFDPFGRKSPANRARTFTGDYNANVQTGENWIGY